MGEVGQWREQEPPDRGLLGSYGEGVASTGFGETTLTSVACRPSAPVAVIQRVWGQSLQMYCKVRLSVGLKVLGEASPSLSTVTIVAFRVCQL